MRVYTLFIILILTAIVSLFVGVKDIDFTEVFSLNSEQKSILFVSRLPRTIALILTGVGISISGLIMQQITQNKFVSPTTAGTLEASKLGILIALLAVPQFGVIGKILIAFLITFLASIIFLKIANTIRYKSIVFIPIVGLIFGGIINSVTVFFAYQKNIVQDVGSANGITGAWLMGDFSQTLQGNYELLYLCVPAVILTYLYASRFTLVGMGENFAKNLGLNYRTVLNIGLFCVSITVSAIIITVGIIPFLGLIIPNIVSLLLGDNLQKTLPYTAIFGALFLLICDIIGRLVIFPFEIPIGMTVGLIGGILFLVLLLKNRR